MSDARNRPVVLDTGVLRAAPRVRGRAARAVLGVALVTVLATGAVAAGGWSIMTAAVGGTPANGPDPLWYAPPDEVGESAATPSTAGPAPAPVPKRTLSAPRATPAETRGGGNAGRSSKRPSARPSSSPTRGGGGGNSGRGDSRADRADDDSGKGRGGDDRGRDREGREGRDDRQDSGDDSGGRRRGKGADD